MTLAIPPFPPKALRVEISVIDGQPMVTPACARCAHYGYHVSPREATGGLGVAARRITLASLNRLEAAHKCPAEVTALAEADTRPAAGLSTAQLRDGANHQNAGAYR